MIFIRDLNDEQKSRIIRSLEEDGFTDIVDQHAYISFSKKPRNFELYSINLNEEYNAQLGLDIYLEEELFFSDLLKDQESTLVNFAAQQKVRHSTSLSQKEDSDIATAIESIGWHLENQYNFSDDQYISRPESSTEMLHLLIKNKDHFALNHGPGNSYCVYEGSPEIMLALTQEDPENFFDASALKKVLRDIKEEMSNS